MRIGLVHPYQLFGSGSCLYVRLLAEALSLAGESVDLISAEQKPQDYPWIREAFLHDGAEPERLFVHPKAAGCVAHALAHSIYPTAYRRMDMRQLPAKVLSDFSDREIGRYVAETIAALERIVRWRGLEILHVQHTLLLPYVASLIKERTGVPYVVTVHGTMIEYVLKKDPRFLRYALAGLGGADAVAVLNEDGRRRVLAIDPRLRPRIAQVPIGIKVERFSPLPASGRARGARRLLARIGGSPTHGMKTLHRRRLYRAVRHGTSGAALRSLVSEVRAAYNPFAPDQGLARGLARIDWRRDTIVAFVGQHHIAKGIHTLLAALPLVLRRLPRCRLLIVGCGAFREGLELILATLDQGDLKWLTRNEDALLALDPDPRPLEHLYRFLERHGPEFQRGRPGTLWDRVHFTGYLTMEFLPFCLPLADLCAIPSIIPEAFPLVTVEAMASGVVPLGTDLGGLGDVLRALGREIPGRSSPLYYDARPGSATALLAGRILALAPRPETGVGNLGFKRALHALAEETYSWRGMAARFVELYGRVRSRPLPAAAPAGSGRLTTASRR